MLYLFQQLNNLLGETFVLVFHLLKLALVVGLGLYLWRRFGQRLFSSDDSTQRSSTPTPRPTSPAPHPIPSRAFSKPTGASTNARTAVPTALTSPPRPSAACTALAVRRATPC